MRLWEIIRVDDPTEISERLKCDSSAPVYNYYPIFLSLVSEPVTDVDLIDDIRHKLSSMKAEVMLTFSDNSQVCQMINYMLFEITKNDPRLLEKIYD